MNYPDGESPVAEHMKKDQRLWPTSPMAEAFAHDEADTLWILVGRLLRKNQELEREVNRLTGAVANLEENTHNHGPLA